MNIATNRFFTLDEATQLASEQHWRCRQTTLNTAQPLIFSHTTALTLHGMTARLSTTLDTSKLHVTVNAINKKSHLRGIEYHVWTGGMNYQYIDDRVAVVSAEQAICQIARTTDQDSLTVAMDWLTCHNPAMRKTTHHELERRIASMPRFPGSRRCHAALGRSVEGTDSPQETVLRLSCIDRGLPVPEVNYVIFDPANHDDMRVDLAYPDIQLVIEYDGEYHYDKQRWRFDIHKRNRLQDLGWKVVVAVKTDFRDERSLNALMELILHAFAESKHAGFTRSFGALT